MLKDHYAVLGINHSATNNEIRKRWRELAHKYHPDHNPDDPLAVEHFKEAREAYRVLSDKTLRLQYDAGWLLRPQGEAEVPRNVNHYFHVVTDTVQLQCFDELSVIFTYSGEGRIFRRPAFDGFHITGSPFVNTRMVVHEGHRLKETSLTYIVCPLAEGQLTIGSASIRIQHITFQTSPLHITVTPNRCFFIKNQNADGKPLKLAMHYEFNKGEEPWRISENKKNHILLIPRSRTAYIFHTIATTLKVVATLWGTIMFNYYFDWGLLYGALAGNILGGINVWMMYLLVNVKPKFRYAPQYPLVQEYIDRGYYFGESAGIPLIKGNFFYFLGRMLI